MSLSQRTIFTHIPKVAGTSIMHQLIRPNFKPQAIKQFRGVPDLLSSRGDGFAMLVGHTPFGIGQFAGGDCRYFVMLRDPVKRALSHYHFIRRPTENPDTPESNQEQKRIYRSTSLSDIFEVNAQRRYRLFSTWLVDNMQTRYVAGWPHYWRAKESPALLAAAKRNLESRFATFGLQEQFGESLERIASKFGWQVGEAQARHKATPPFEMPDVATMQVVHDNHRLDAELYEFAQRLFDKG